MSAIKFVNSRVVNPLSVSSRDWGMGLPLSSTNRLTSSNGAYPEIQIGNSLFRFRFVADIDCDVWNHRNGLMSFNVCILYCVAFCELEIDIRISMSNDVVYE